MFQIRKFRSRGLSRTLGLSAASAAVLALAASAGAADWPWRHDRSRKHDHHDSRRGHDHKPGIVIQPRIVIGGGPRIVFPPRPPVIVTQPCDTVPANLRISAYQSRDTIIILVSGENQSAGYATALTCADASGWTPTITLRNTPPAECATQACTPFSLSASIRSQRALCTINVKVAGQTFQTAVTEVPCL